jgi:Raf kinase inhibitor-like YbhB/YbcL family protein
MWNLEPGKAIKENSSPGTEGKNSLDKKGYTGPCPPAGSIHHYHFKVYALNAKLDLGTMANKTQLENAMQSHILAQGELIGLYGKTK